MINPNQKVIPMKKYFLTILNMLFLFTLASCDREDIMGDTKLLPKFIPNTTSVIPYHNNIVAHWTLEYNQDAIKSVNSNYYLQRMGYLWEAPFGKFGSALSGFSNDNYYYWEDLSRTGTTEFDKDFMVEVWVSSTDFLNTQTIISKNTLSASKGWSCRISSAGLAQIWYGTGTTVDYITNSKPLTTGWHYLAFIFRNSTREGVVYLDGIVTETMKSLMTYSASTTEMILGCDNDTPSNMNPFNGLIDDVVFWGDIDQVSDATIRQYIENRWNGGVGKQYSDSPGTIVLY